MNPADVMDLPVGLLEEMHEIVRDEARAARRAQARAKAGRR